MSKHQDSTVTIVKWIIGGFVVVVAIALGYNIHVKNNETTLNITKTTDSKSLPTNTPQTIDPSQSPYQTPTPERVNNTNNFVANTQAADKLVREESQYSDMYQITGGINYITVFEKKTCEELNSGTSFTNFINALYQELKNKRPNFPTITDDQFLRLKEYTTIVILVSIQTSCPQHSNSVGEALKATGFNSK